MINHRDVEAFLPDTTGENAPEIEKICINCLAAVVPSTAKGCNKVCADCWPIIHGDAAVCAWCYPGSKGNSFGSHGICREHQAEELAKLHSLT